MGRSLHGSIHVGCNSLPTVKRFNKKIGGKTMGRGRDKPKREKKKPKKEKKKKKKK